MKSVIEVNTFERSRLLGQSPFVHVTVPTPHVMKRWPLVSKRPDFYTKNDMQNANYFMQ